MKTLYVIVATIMLLAIASCSKNDVASNSSMSTSKETLSEELNNDDPHALSVLPMVFASVEEFVTYIKTVEKDSDIFDLSRIYKYYQLNGIPENYHLYKITAGRRDVGFWYLPKEYLVSEDTIQEAESKCRNFLLIFTRWELESPMKGIKEQHRFTDDDMIKGKYLYKTMPYILFWEADGEVMMLYLPTDLPKDVTDFPKVTVINLEQVYSYAVDVVYIK